MSISRFDMEKSLIPAKRETKPNKANWNHRPNRKGFRIVGPEDVLKKLAEHGVYRDKRTLQRYVKAGIIPKPIKVGRNVVHTDNAPALMYASIKTLSDIPQLTTEDITTIILKIVNKVVTDPRQELDNVDFSVLPQNEDDIAALLYTHWMIHLFLFMAKERKQEMDKPARDLLEKTMDEVRGSFDKSAIKRLREIE